MLVIASGEYVETELSAEFGRIPPAFLPVGNKRLYTYQIGQLESRHETIWMTLPDDFELDEADRRDLAQRGVRLFRTCTGVSLGAAMRAFLRTTAITGAVDILYGDTLIADAPVGGTDWLAIGDSDENYHWHQEAARNGRPGGTWCGMFSFSNAERLCAHLDDQKEFIPAVTAYGQSTGHWQHRVVDKWMDFGHIHTYFDSKREITTQRHFNHLRVANGVLTKSSIDARKMAAEADWFEQAPASVKPFLPSYIARKENAPSGYVLEYMHLAALNELYVFGRLPQRVWKKIFAACNTYLDTASRVPLPAKSFDNGARATYYDKTAARLLQFSQQADIDLDRAWSFNGLATPSLRVMSQQAAHTVLRNPDAASFIHGDLCFSNILFDFRAGRIKIIDPRGLDAQGNATAFGDMRYEIGKLAHSVIGLYDFIIAGFFDLEISNDAVQFVVHGNRIDPVKALFLNTEFLGRRPASWDCHPIMLLLFLSMLPLHADDPRRQQALMANCLRIYLDWTNDHHPNGWAE